MKDFRTLVVAIAVLSPVVAVAAVDIRITNYPASGGVVVPVLGDHPVLASLLGYGVPFTPDNQDGAADEVLPVGDLRIGVQEAAFGGPYTDLSIFVAADNGGEPGAQVGLFLARGSLPVGGWDADVTLTPVTPFQVTENQLYWLVYETTGQTGVAYSSYAAAGNDPFGRIGTPIGLGAGGWTESLTSGVPVFTLVIP